MPGEPAASQSDKISARLLYTAPKTGTINAVRKNWKRKEPYDAELLYSECYLSCIFLSGLGGGDGSRDHPGRKVCQPRCGGRPVLLYLRYHRRAAGREFRRPARRAGLPVLCLHDGGNGDGMDHRQAVGTPAPPQVVGLFRQKIQSERLCVPAVFAAVGCTGHGKCAVGQ